MHHVVSTCPLCNSAIETVEHLFLECNLSKQVWEAMQVTVPNMLDGTGLVDCICSWFSNGPNNNRMPNTYMLVSIGHTFWHFWKFRCVVVFDNAQLQVHQLVQNIKKSILEWNENLIKQTSRQRQTVSGRSVVQWQTPLNSFIKINFDAYFCKEIKYMETGLIMLNDAGDFKRAWRVPAVAENPEQVEALAVFEAIQLARRKGILNLHVKGDCRDVVDALNGKDGVVKWQNNSIIRDCVECFKYFNNWVVTYVPRETNSMADLLAKDAISMYTSTSWDNNPPDWILSIMREKLNVQPFQRLI
ncbi:uncharacterized protein LOC113331881 [Papaver somniferum]|uniref:uncharacterized protein LOC113331881 n=1 Tax=Papaver somniferum TaxID=3469 RepID=UPI000E6F799B|nr:uncharacterized protein LOC113331881 [Papaver somniferum]